MTRKVKNINTNKSVAKIYPENKRESKSRNKKSTILFSELKNKET